jgi:tetratricopeptide (TPR) repeat protein
MANNLAMVLGERGRLSEAQTLLEQSLALRTNLYGVEHRQTLQSMNNLAANLAHQKKHDEAEALWRRTLELRERVLGSAHLETRTTASNLADLLTQQGRLEEALDLYRDRVITPAPEGDVWQSAFFEVNYGVCLLALRRYEEAERSLDHGFDVLTRAFGLAHPHTQRALRNLIRTVKARGESDRLRALRPLLRG